MSENVKVCVRVRPFNSREKERKAKLIIGMNGNVTTIVDPQKPDEKPREFAFDQSYWSHDGFKEDENGLLVAQTEKYATQKKVFDDLGAGVLKNAYEGYNTSLFAYGQTGSGKSYSMVGYGANKGIVPIAFETMFNKINSNTDENVKYQVTFSMIEIYMEQVSDLLAESSKKLKVREDPKEGRFFVDGVLKTPVSSYNEINSQMEGAMKRRTVAATQMNATSSRAHTVVTVIFTSLITDAETGKKTTRSSEVNLIDLAGSERANSTGATGARLKEGAKINLSLSALGNVIAALASGKKAPFRDSVLTKLLQNSLGGNAKTIMIAALSPADINFEETLSTLRYADRAKQIKNKAVVNESATDKLIRSLKEENERMKKMLEGKMPAAQTAGMSEEQVEKMRKDMEASIRAQILENEAKTKMMDEDSYARELARIKEEYETKAKADKKKQALDLTSFRLENINEDPALSSVVVHQIVDGETVLGRKAKSNPHNPAIELAGLSINDKHCIFKLKNTEVTLSIPEGVSPEESKTAVNGKPVANDTVLKHGDRILFGTNHLYVYRVPNPTKEDIKRVPENVDWEFAQSEIMANKGFAVDTGDDSLHLSDETREKVMELLPMVSVANAISERLDEKRAFEVAVLSGPVAGLQRNESKVMVKMRNLDTNNKWMIESADFIQRHFEMQRLLQKLAGEEDEDGASVDDYDDEDDEASEDPFAVEDSMVILGTSTCFFQSLCYHIEFDDALNIVDYKGRSEGKLSMSVYPCDEAGVLRDTNDVNEDPKDLLGKSISFKLTISGATIKKKKYSKKTMVKFSHEYIGGEFETAVVAGENPTWNYQKVFTIKQVNDQVLEWLLTGNVGFFVYVWQSDSNAEDTQNSYSTADMMVARRASGLTSGIDDGGQQAVALQEQLKQNQTLKGEINKLKAQIENAGGKKNELDQLRKADSNNKSKILELQSALAARDNTIEKVRELVEGATTVDGVLLSSIKNALDGTGKQQNSSKKSSVQSNGACTIL